jgi:hypothetical protein
MGGFIPAFYMSEGREAKTLGSEPADISFFRVKLIWKCGESMPVIRLSFKSHTNQSQQCLAQYAADMQWSSGGGFVTLQHCNFLVQVVVVSQFVSTTGVAMVMTQLHSHICLLQAG